MKFIKTPQINQLLAVGLMVLAFIQITLAGYFQPEWNLDPQFLASPFNDQSFTITTQFTPLPAVPPTLNLVDRYGTEIPQVTGSFINASFVQHQLQTASMYPYETPYMFSFKENSVSILNDSIVNPIQLYPSSTPPFNLLVTNPTILFKGTKAITSNNINNNICRSFFAYSVSGDYYEYQSLSDQNSILDGVIPYLIQRNGSESIYGVQFNQYNGLTNFTIANIFGNTNNLTFGDQCSQGSIFNYGTSALLSKYDPVLLVLLKSESDFQMIKIEIESNQPTITQFLRPTRDEIQNQYIFKLMKNNHLANYTVKVYLTDTTVLQINQTDAVGNVITISNISTSCIFNPMMVPRKSGLYTTNDENFGILLFISFTTSEYQNLSFVMVTLMNTNVVLYKDYEIYSNVYSKYVPISLGLAFKYQPQLYYSVDVYSIDGQVFNIHTGYLTSCFSDISLIPTSFTPTTVQMPLDDLLVMDTLYQQIDMGGIPDIRHLAVITGDSLFKLYSPTQLQFPFGFNGGSYGGMLNTRVYLQRDFNAKMLTAFLNIDVQVQTLPLQPSVFLQGSVFDAVNPLVKLKFVFDDVNMGTYALLTVTDSIGISESSCHLTIGKSRYYFNSESRIKGDSRAGMYFVPFQFRPMDCILPHLYCEDIRGNAISINNTSPGATQYGLIDLPQPPQCSVIVPRLVHLDYHYSSVQSISYSVTFQTVITVEYVLLSFYFDKDNNLPSRTIQMSCVQPPQSTLFYQCTVSESISLTNTTTFYMALEMKDMVNKSIYHWTTSDIEYFIKPSALESEIVAGTEGNYKIQIRNQGYQGPIVVSPPVQLNVNNIEITTTDISLIKNITLSQTFEGSWDVIPIRYQWLGSKSFVGTIASIPISTSNLCGSNFRVYVDQICDWNENCYKYPMYGYYYQSPSFNSTSCPNNPTFSMPSFTVSITTNVSTIDVSSNNRGFNIIATIDSSLYPSLSPDLMYQYPPILVITEKISNNRINCTTSLSNLPSISNATWACDMELPLNWGLRGVTLSMWGILDKYGHSLGTYDLSIFQPYSSSYNSNSPNIWDFKVLNNKFIVYGSNFGYLQNNQVSINNVPNAIYILNATTAILPLLPSTIEQTIRIGTWTYTISSSCPNSCSGHGNCLLGVCNCTLPFEGIDCSKRPYTCPNSCSGNGDCIDSLCSCNSGFTGPDCSDVVPTGTNVTIVVSPNQPTVNIGDFQNGNLTSLTQNTTFSIKLVSIDEINVFGKVVLSHNMTALDWSLVAQPLNTNCTVLTASIQPLSNVTVKTCLFSSQGSSEWLGNTIQMPPNSIKYYVNVTGYSFGTNLNTLTLVWNSLIEAPRICGDESVEIGGGSSNDMHWVSIPANQLNLYSRFNDKILIDNRITKATNKFKSIKGSGNKRLLSVATEIPHFNQFVSVDPDFSVLVTVNQGNQSKGDCAPPEDTKDNKITTIIVVVVVVGVVGIAAIVVGTILLFKKNQNLRLKLMLMKQKSLKMTRRH